MCVKVRDILSSRTSEEINCVLSISVYDVARNETAKQHRLELVGGPPYRHACPTNVLSALLWLIVAIG